MEYSEQEKIASQIIPDWIEQFHRGELDSIHNYNLGFTEKCMVADFRANIGLSRIYSKYEFKDLFSISKLKSHCYGCEKYGNIFYRYTWKYPIKYWRGSYLYDLSKFLEHMELKHNWKQHINNP